MKTVVLIAAMMAIACHSAQQPAPSSVASTTRDGKTRVETRVTVGESFRPSTDEAELRRFVLEIPPVDSGGECRVVRTSGNGATMVTAFFPSYAAEKNLVTLFFDSAGHLTRYSDSRGEGLRVSTPPGTTEEQRDSLFNAAKAFRRSSVSLDFAIDQGMAINSGGGKATKAVMGNVRQVESLAALGPPVKRIERVRKLCSV